MKNLALVLLAFALFSSAVFANETELLENETIGMAGLKIDRKKPLTASVQVDKVNNYSVVITLYVEPAGCGWLHEDSTFIQIRSKQDILLYTPVKKNSASTCQGVDDRSRPIHLKLNASRTNTVTIAGEAEIIIKMKENANPHLRPTFDSVEVNLKEQQ